MATGEALGSLGGYLTQNAFQPTLKEKVRNGLVRDGLAQKNEDDKNKAAAKVQKKIQEMEWKAVQANYKIARKKVISNIVTGCMTLWKEEHDKKSLRRKNPDKTNLGADLEKISKEYDEDRKNNTTSQIDGFQAETLDQYVLDAKRLRNKDIDKDSEKKSIVNEAMKKYSKAKKKIIDMVKKQITQTMGKMADLQKLAETGFVADKASQQLAEIPLKIDEQITKMKDKFDVLLGKAMGMYPDSPTFNLQKVMALLMAVVNPVISATDPLAAVAGKIPILGNIAQLVALAGSSSAPSTSMSNEQIEEIIKNTLPPIPNGLKDKAQGLISDIKDMIPILPMVLINMIFAILNVIYSKLQMITSIIPLGSLFPLNLIPTAITAVPLMTTMMMALPGYAEAMIEGMIRQKIAEAMAMKIPSTKIDPNLLASLVADIWDDEKTKRMSTKKKDTYKSVIEKFYREKGHAMGYTQSQLKEVMKNYLKIRDGSEIKLTKYTDDGPQDLANFGLMAQLGFSENPQAEVNKEEEALGYDDSGSVTRSTPTPEDFEAYLNGTCKDNMIEGSDQSSGANNSQQITYEKVYDLKDILGGFYDSICKQVTEKVGDPVVLMENLPKSPLRTGSFLSGQ